MKWNSLESINHNPSMLILKDPSLIALDFNLSDLGVLRLLIEHFYVFTTIMDGHDKNILKFYVCI